MTEKLHPTTGSQGVSKSDQPASESEGTVKIAVRLLDSLNGPLRQLVQYQGELASFVNEALRTVDLKNEPLVVIRDLKVRDTSVRVEQGTFQKLVATAKERKTSVNILVNTAIAHWLGRRVPQSVVRFKV